MQSNTTDLPQDHHVQFSWYCHRQTVYWDMFLIFCALMFVNGVNRKNTICQYMLQTTTSKINRVTLHCITVRTEFYKGRNHGWAAVCRLIQGYLIKWPLDVFAKEWMKIIFNLQNRSFQSVLLLHIRLKMYLKCYVHTCAVKFKVVTYASCLRRSSFALCVKSWCTGNVQYLSNTRHM